MGTEGFLEIVDIRVCIFKIGLKVKTLTLKPVSELLNALVKAVLIHSLRNLALYAVYNLLNKSVLDSFLCRFLLTVKSLFLKVCLKLLESIELAYVLRKLIVNLRKLANLYLMQLYLENSFLTCKLFGTVILGEGNVYVKLVADVLSDNLLLKAGNKLA